MLAVIRIRGETGLSPDSQKTTELLRLHKINHLVVIEDNPISRGMMNRVENYVTWGEIDKDTLTVLLKEKALFKGRRRIAEDNLKESTGYDTYGSMAEALLKGEVKYKDIKDIVPVIRLNPPYKGYEAIRKHFKKGGSAGYRGAEINKLIKRMIKPGVDLNGKNEN
ncbi:MAG: 50S ribosomal protein L30 [Thermoplasmatales archaeon B_DKE]|nr:MAG: 50S ribosomal protein L30 [Thermoplasmatales archaeon B_DKE]QRF76002.1 PfL30 [Thermoplasmatales archaeon]